LLEYITIKALGDHLQISAEAFRDLEDYRDKINRFKGRGRGATIRLEQPW